MLTKASIVVMSHLSDIQEYPINCGTSYDKINFVKYIILQTKGNLNQDINPDTLYNNFLKNHTTHEN